MIEMRTNKMQTRNRGCYGDYRIMVVRQNVDLLVGVRFPLISLYGWVA